MGVMFSGRVPSLSNFAVSGLIEKRRSSVEDGA
jgi:hypothetical protein